jgi:hypothetical protein
MLFLQIIKEFICNIELNIIRYRIILIYFRAFIQIYLILILYCLNLLLFYGYIILLKLMRYNILYILHNFTFNC